MKRRILVASMLALTGAIVAIPAAATQGSEAGPRAPELATNGRIAFQALVGRDGQVFTIRPDGTGLTQVTDLRTDDPGPGAGEPSWSPDGSRIAFHTATRFTAPLFTRVNLFTIAPDGTDLTELPLAVRNFNGDPAYSPDGKQISFDQDVSKAQPTVHGIFIADADGSDARRLTTSFATKEGFDTESQWSPDGTTIAFTRVKNERKAAIFTVQIDGTGLTQLTPYRLDAASPDWSPDGSTIAFNSYWDSPGGKAARIFTMRPDGSDMTAITSNERGTVFSFRPSWSPDGTRIVFARAEPRGKHSFRLQLFTMKPRGGGIEQLTHMPEAFPVNPDWGTAP